LRALEPLLTPLNALPDEEGRLTEGLDLGCEALGDGLGRLTLGDAVGRLADGVPVAGRAPTLPVEGRVPVVPVEGRAPAVPAEGRAPTLPVEGPAPPELQPRASELRAVFAALGEPLLLSRLWSGCHFVCALVDDARAPEALVDRALLTLAFRLALALRLTLTFWLTLMSTSP
jgi:hypothetical protein